MSRLTNYRYCRKCGAEIIPVEKWEDAICNDPDCIIQSENELNKGGKK